MDNELKILPCKVCGSQARIACVEIAEDDDWKYTFEMYYVRCCNEECDNYYVPDHELSYTEEDAIEVWNEIQKRD